MHLVATILDSEGVINDFSLTSKPCVPQASMVLGKSFLEIKCALLASSLDLWLYSKTQSLIHYKLAIEIQ